MRLRVAHWLEQRGLTAYELAKRSDGRISLSAAYRLTAGSFKTISAATLDALCDVLSVDPGELFERDTARREKRRRPA